MISSAKSQLNILIFLVGIIAVFVFGTTLMWLDTVLLPFVIAVLLSIIFDPIVTHLKSKRVPVVFALLSVVLICAVVIFLVGFIVYSSAVNVSTSLPTYESKLKLLLIEIENSIGSVVAAFGTDLREVKFSDLVPFSRISELAGTIANSFLSLTGNTVMVLLFMMFILAGSGELELKIRKGFSTGEGEKIVSIVKNVSGRVRQYLVTKTILSLVTGITYGIVLWIFGVEFPIFWGFLAFVLNFIPNIGSLIATIFPVLLSLLQFDSIVTSIILAIVLIVVQNIFGNILEPKLMSQSLNLSALLILVSLIFWGWLWGIPGMILSVPLTATIKIIFENIPQLRPIAVLMEAKVEITEVKIPVEIEKS